MPISKNVAMEIVKQLAIILKQDITFMDTTAHIIACTQENRIGDFHEGGYTMLSKKMEKIVIHSDDEYVGSRAGINFPIEINGQTVGVVGITGRAEDVSMFGEVVKKMTEILLQNEDLKEKKMLNHEARARFMQDWIANEESYSKNSLYDIGLSFGIDTTLPRRVVVATSNTFRNNKNIILEQKNINHIAEIISSELAISEFMLTINSNFVCFLVDYEKSDEKIIKRLEYIRDKVLQLSKTELFFGIDSFVCSEDQIPKGYRRAKHALSNATALLLKWGSFFNEIDIGMIVEELPSRVQQNFVRRIFAGIPDDEIEQWKEMLTVFYSCNGSIEQCSKKLLIHKNTLQYKLNKLHKKTGYNPRNIYDSSLFALAIIFHNRLIWG